MKLSPVFHDSRFCFHGSNFLLSFIFHHFCAEAGTAGAGAFQKPVWKQSNEKTQKVRGQSPDTCWLRDCFRKAFAQLCIIQLAKAKNQICRRSRNEWNFSTANILSRRLQVPVIFRPFAGFCAAGLYFRGNELYNIYIDFLLGILNGKRIKKIFLQSKKSEIIKNKLLFKSKKNYSDKRPQAAAPTVAAAQI